jgi:ComF family protein
MPIQYESKFNHQQICLSCLQKKPSYDFGHAIFIYNETIGKAIIDLKYNDQIFLANKFAKLLRNQIDNIIKEVDFIASVPIHSKKLVQRKYNQANLIARNIYPKKYFPQLLLRIKNDNSQVKLSKNKRIKNLSKTFIVNPKFSTKIIGKKILLIDDVMTTSTTLNYCSKALRQSMVSKIYVAVIAKTIRNKFN